MYYNYSFKKLEEEESFLKIIFLLVYVCVIMWYELWMEMK